MKALTRKFKEGFRRYDYISQDIDILIGLLDIVLEMMTVIELEDHDNIKKLSSFIRLLSSGYSNTIIDAAMIEEIYDTSIMPVLDHFDKKYSTRFVAITSNKIVNGVPHIDVFTDEKVIFTSDEFCSGNMDVQAYRKFLRDELAAKNKDIEDPDTVVDVLKLLYEDQIKYNEEIIKLNKFIVSNKDTNDPNILESIFNMSKDIVSILYNIYDNFTSGKSQELREKYIQDLILLRDTMEIISRCDDTKIQLISDVIRSLCYSLIDELNRNVVIPPSSIILIELKFKSLEDIKYK